MKLDVPLGYVRHINLGIVWRKGEPASLVFVTESSRAESETAG